MVRAMAGDAHSAVGFAIGRIASQVSFRFTPSKQLIYLEPLENQPSLAMAASSKILNRRD